MIRRMAVYYRCVYVNCNNNIANNIIRIASFGAGLSTQETICCALDVEFIEVKPISALVFHHHTPTGLLGIYLVPTRTYDLSGQFAIN